MVEVSALEKRYGDKAVLRDLNFTVGRSEIVGLLGLNGAGKSTTMNILTGYISPSSGTVKIDGHDIMKDPVGARRVTGYLPEQLAFYNEMRVDEYLGFVCDLKGFTRERRARREHLDELSSRVGIEHIRGRMIRNLSKGYRQRVGFAQALIGCPKLLILDEPTVGLDPSQIIEIRNLIRSAGKDATVIVSSHILSEIQTICQRVLVLNGGRIIADGAPGDLVKPARHTMTIRVRGGEADVRRALESLALTVTALPAREEGAFDARVAGEAGGDIRAEVFYALCAAKLPLIKAGGGEATLEDVFLRLVAGGQNAGEGEI